MAYYYVKNGGTATGDAGRYASQQTGSFATLGAANYYDNITSAIAATTSPVASDFINVSDLHAFSTASSITLTGASVNPFFIVAVDDANIDAARTSGNRATETMTGAGDLIFTNLMISGVSLVVEDNITLNSSSQSYFVDSKVTSVNSGNSFLSISDDVVWTLVNSDIHINGATTLMWMGGGTNFNMSGGSISSTVGINNLFGNDALGGGFSVNLDGVDLSGVTGNILAVGSSVGDDHIELRADMCKLDAGVVLVSEVFRQSNKRALFTRCSDSSSAAEYQYHLTAFGGDVDDDSAIYRNESPSFADSGQKISYQIVTNSDASLGSPLWFDMPLNKWSPLSVGATDTLRFYLTSNTALTDKDIYIEISYPDGTNKQTPNFLTSAPATVGGTLDLMATGTTLTTDATSTWTGGLTNKYQIDLDTSSDDGADTYPIIKVYITKPSVTINLAMDFTPL